MKMTSAVLAALVLLVVGQTAHSCSILNAVLEVGVVYTLSSINFPQPYPDYSHSCRFTATAPVNTKVYMICDVFDILYTIGCTDARLTFSPSGNLNSGDGRWYCGFTESLRLNTNGNRFAMQFDNYFYNSFFQTGYRCNMTAIADATTQAPPASTTKPSTCSCGIKNVASRIVGGAETQVNEYPWMAALRYANSYEQYCGGALISSRWVLTASHCLDINIKPADIKVTLGGHYRSVTNDVSSLRTYSVEQIIVHEAYDDVTVDNDIGLVKLSRDVAYTSTISPACLPFRFPKADFHGQKATVSGWGTTSYQGATSTTLHEVEVPILGKAQCANGFKSVKDKLTNNMFCTFALGKDACQGDSGGPLQYEFEGRSYVIGVVSWGIECATPDNPGVFSKVNNYLGWIKAKTGNTFCGEV